MIKQWHQFSIIIICIPLDFEILESSLPVYQCDSGSRLTYELTFADYSDVIKSLDSDASYTISDISLEFDTVTNASLAGQIGTKYLKSSILYDRILRSRIIRLNKSDTRFSFDINSPSKSLYPSFTKGGSSRPPKGFSSITFEQNYLETSNFAYCNFNNINLGGYDQI